MTRWFFSMCAIGVIAGPLLVGTAHAQRVELRPVGTVTLTIQQFLKDRTNGTRTTIAGEFIFRRQGLTGSLPSF